ncbi:MAG: DNA-binding response regulator, partial [Flavisolibacter sp.]|nr:DNA-binding response regulator [Flavisolibacter sp.]
MKLRCITIDDEPLARKVIKEYIEDIDFLEFAGEAENPVKAVPLLNTTRVDLI